MCKKKNKQKASAVSIIIDYSLQKDVMQITWKSLKISEIIFQLFKYKRVRLYLTGALFAAVSHLDLVYPNKWLILNPRVHRNRLYISHLKNKLW